MSFSPPLGTTSTALSSSCKLYFSVIAPPPSVSPEVWTNLPCGDWHSVAFARDDSGLTFAEIELDGQEGLFEYTYRYRNEDGSYTWLGGEGSNGKVVLAPPAVDQTLVGARTRTIAVDIPNGSSNECYNFGLEPLLDIGFDLRDAEGVTLEQREPTWFIPRRIMPSSNPLSALSTSFPAQYLYLRIPSSSRIIFLLPLSTPKISSCLLNVNGQAVLRCTRDETGPASKGHLVVGFAQEGELKTLVKACISEASSTLAKVSSSVASVISSPKHHLRGITWCTWNALGPSYTLSSVLDSLKKIRTSTSALYAQSVDSVLLDDGWQDTTEHLHTIHHKGSRRLKSFGVRSGWFDLREETVEGHELKVAINQIKMHGISRVGVWLTLAGYWDAIDPSSSLASTYNVGRFCLESEAHPSNNGSWYLPSTRSDLRAFYTDYFTSLKSSGIDFIKVDDQAHTDYLVSADDLSVDVGALRTAMYEEMRSAAHSTFGIGNVTHCMAHSPRVFGSAFTLLPTISGAQDVLRNSDDYFPLVDKSHGPHVYYNALTSILTSEFKGVKPDFDMCEQEHKWGEFHITWRSFQAAPVLSTDRGGSVSKDGPWDRMVGRTKRGATKLVQGNDTGSILEGRICEDVIASGDGPSLKAGLTNRNSAAAVLGLWNCRDNSSQARDVVDARDVVEVFGGEPLSATDYVIFVKSNGRSTTVKAEDLQVAKGSSRITAKPLLDFTLGPREVQGIAVAPLHTFKVQNISVACLGLLGKFGGPVGLTSVYFGPRLPSILGPLANRPPPPPKAEGRVALILSTFFPLVLRSQMSPLPPPPNSRRTIAQLLFNDIWKSPIVTIWREFTTLIRFTFSALAWTIKFKFDERNKGLCEPQLSNGLAKINNNDGFDNMKKDEVLRFETPFSERIGLYIQQGDVSTLSVKVDGIKLPKSTIKSVIDDGKLFEIDLGALVDAGVLDSSTDKNENWIVEIYFE